MGQRAAAALMQNIFRAAFAPGVAIALLILVSPLGCDRNSSPASPASPAAKRSPASTRSNDRVTIASLVPAATDMLIGMGAADHLIAVSNWDADRPEIHDLP